MNLAELRGSLVELELKGGVRGGGGDGGARGSRRGTLVVDEAAARAVGAGACLLVVTADLRLVLGMAQDGAQLVLAVGELALGT